MNEMQAFVYESGEVRTIMVDNEPWFVLRDICEALSIENIGNVAARLDSDERSDIRVMDTSSNGVSQNRSVTIINESGLYNVILRSDKPEAKKFKKWVTSEVLPSIRKNGMYATDITIDRMVSDPDFAIALLTNLKEEREKRVIAERRNAVLMHVSKLYTATEIAKELGMRSAHELNEVLSEKKIQFKQNDTWVPYAQYSDLGYFSIKQTVLDSGKIVYDRKITQDGRAFIIELIRP